MNQNYNFVRGLLTLVSNARNEEFATKKGTSFKSLLLLVVFALFAGISMQGQTYFTESFEGAWYLNGNSSTAANATGPNAPSGWTQTRVLNDVVSAGSAAGAHDWAQSVYNAGYLSNTPPYVAQPPYISGNPGVAPAGTNVLWFFDGNTNTGNTRRMASPAINLSASTNPVLTFSYSYAQNSTSLSVVGSLDNGVTWNTISVLPLTSSTAYSSKLIILPLAYKIANAKIGFQIAAAYGSYDAFIDNVVIREGVASNATPTLFTSTPVTATTTTIGWTDNSTNETAFKLYRSVDNVNFTQIGADIASTTTAGTGTAYSSVQTGLLPGTTYYYKISSVLELESSFLIGTQATLPPGSITSIASGNWSQTTTWSSGTIPTATDNVIIADGHTVNIDLVAPTCLDLTVGQGTSGVLTFTSTLVASLTVNGSITVAAGGNFNAGSTATIVHNIFLGGGTATSPYASNLIVNGTFDMWQTATTGRATLTFFGIQNSVISGAGTLDLNNTNIINKGATTATALVTPPVLELQRAFTVQGANTLGFVTTLTAGTLKIGGTFTQANPIFVTASYTIPAAAGIWLNNPNFTIAGLAGSPAVTGLFRVTTGTYNIGTATGNSLGSGTNSVYIIEGGAINVTGRFNLTSSGVYYNQSGGTLSVATIGNTSSATASFGITSATGTSFIMSGGTIVLVQRTTGATIRDYYVVATPTITGGTLQVGTAATATNFNFRLYGYAPNIDINNTTNNKKVEVYQLTGVLFVYGTLTVNPGTTFDCLGMTATALGNVVNNGTIQGLVTGSRFDFQGTTPQTYSGSGTFGTAVAPFIGIGVGIANYTNVTLNSPIVTTRVNLFGGSFINSNQITLGNAGASTGYVQRGGGTAAAGTFDVAPTFNVGTGGLTVSYNTSTVNTSTALEIPSTRVVNSFIVNNANGATLSGGALSSAALTLTLGNLTTTSTNLLTVSGTTTGSITGGSATSFVNGPIARTLPLSLVTGSNYSFPVGKTTYNPFVLVNPTTNAGGTVTVQSEVVEANTGGTAGTLMGTLNTNKYWASSITAGATNFTDSLIQLNDTPNGADAIAASTTLTGAYNIVGGVAITSTATSLTSTAPASTSLPGFYVMGNKAAATLTNLVITPSGNQCSIVSRTVSVTATPGGGAVTGVVINYSVNGTAQTAIPMTNTSGNVWSAVIPTVSPINALVTWSVIATDANLLTKTAIGTPYSDESLLGVNATASATVTSLCAGNSSVLTAVGSTPGVRSLGLGASTSSSSGASMFNGGWGGLKTQYIIKASELAAAGIAAGNISSLAFEATTAFNGYEGFALNIGHTEQTFATMPLITTGLTQVYTGAGTNGAYATTIGVNTLTFSTPFVWNGYSNIVVSFCWSKNPTATSTTATTVKVDSPGFVCTAYGQKDSTLPASFCPLATAAEFGTSGTGTSRPKFTFNCQSAASFTTVVWSNGTTTVGTTNPLTVSPTVNTTYTATMTNSTGCSITTTPVTVTVNTLPTAPIATNATQCGTQLSTAHVASSTGLPTPIFVWYAAQTGGTALQSNTSTTYLTALSTTTTLYVSEFDGFCESLRTPVVFTVTTPPTVAVSASTTSFCGTGGATTLTATSPDTGMTFAWTSLNPSATLSATSGAIVNASLTETSDFMVTGTATNATCLPINAYVSIGVYPLPTATVTTTAQGVCPGTSATIGSGLSAGNFTAICLPTPSGISSAPANAVSLVGGSALILPYPAGVTANSTSLDDNYWAGIPVGFTFNYFGSNVTSVFIGSNGTINLGTTGSTQYNFSGPPSGFPSTANPASTVAVCARDLRWDNGGKINYWTEGIAPNRRFVVQFLNAKPYSYTTGNQTAEAVFYETLGTIDIRVFEATNGLGTTAGTSTSKYIGLQDATRTIGATAPNCSTTPTTASYWNGQLDVIDVAAPKAWRFSPPSNYTTSWYANGSLIPAATGFANPGTNVFNLSVAPTTTTTYSISYTNQTTGCTNAAGSAQVLMAVLGNVAPTGVNTISSASPICSYGDTVNLSLDYTGIMDGLTFQWQSSPDGIAWTDIPAITTTTYSVVPTAATQYRCKIVACNGVPGFSNPVSLNFANSVVSTTPNTRCGTGTTTLEATGNTGTTINWYANATGGAVLYSGATFTTPSITATTTYYAEAITGLGSGFAGAAGPAVSTNGTSVGSHGIMITTTAQNVNISTVDIPFTGTGTFTIALKDTNNTTVITSVTTGTVTGNGLTPVTVPLNLVVPAAGSYSLIINAVSGSIGALGYSTTTYPYSALGGVFSVTGGYWYGTSTSNMYLYNLNVSSGCSSQRVPVIATVTTPPIMVLSGNPATICSEQTTAAVSVVTGLSDYDTYAWTPAGSVTGTPAAGWVFNPLATTAYTLAVSQSTGVRPCATTTGITVTVNPTPSVITIAPTPATVCVDTVLPLVATGGTLPINGIVGTDTTENTSTSYPAPYTNYYGGAKHQMLIRASELTALGFANGAVISKIAFNVNSVGSTFSGVLNDFQIDMGHTTNSVLSSASFEGSLITVLPLSNTPIPTTGLPANVTHTLVTPFVWNGIDNLVIQTSYSNGNSGASTDGVTMTNSDPGFVSTNYYRADSVSSSAILSAATPSGSVNARPNMIITASAPTTMSWSPTTNLYSNAAGTTPYTGGNASTVYFKSSSAAPAATYTATASSALGCVRTATVPVTVNANTTMALTSANATQTVCTGTAIANIVYTLTAATGVTATLPAGLTGTLVGGTYTISGIPTASGAISVTGTGLCLSSATLTGTITVNPNTTLALLSATATQTVCYGVAISDIVYTVTNGTGVTATLPAGLTGTYAGGAYTISGTPTASGTISVSGTGLCLPSAALTGVITVNQTPVPTAAAAQTVCYGATIADLSATGTLLKWYAASTGGTALATSTALVTGTTYYVSQTLLGCEGLRAAITVTITTTPAPTGLQFYQFCPTGGATLNDITATLFGTAIKWYATPAGGVQLASSTPLAQGYYWATQTANGCESPTRFPVFAISNATAAPSSNPLQQFCISATIANLTANGSGLQWYATSTGGVALASSASIATGTYYVSQTSGGCESPRTAVAVIVTVVPNPTASAQTFCNSGTVAGLSATGSGLNWYSAATGGVALASTTALATGTYYVSQTINGCEGSRTAVSVTVNTTLAPTATAQTFCNSGTVSALVATGTALNWYSSLTGGAALANTTALATGTYYVSQTVNACESPRTAVSVTVNTTSAPNATATQTFCNSATVAGLTATGTGLNWYSTSTGGTALASTTALTTGTTYYVSQTISGCQGPRTAVSVIINTTPAPTGAATQSLSSLLTVGSIVVTGTNIVWYASSANAASGTNPLSPSQLLANTTYYATQTVSGCTSTTSLAVTITTLANQDFDMTKFSYYPNPVIDLLNISYSQDMTSVKVFNVIGQELLNKVVNATSTQIDMSAYPNGAYFIQVATEDAMKTVRVIKK